MKDTTVDEVRVEMFREKLDILAISDYHGLKSPGLTCYLNSVLQVLFMTDDFRSSVKQCCSKDPSAFDTLLGNMFAKLETGLAKTHVITKKLRITDVYEQRDAAEYLEKILCLSSPEASKIFKGELSHKTTCVTCKQRTDSRSLFWILPLPMEDSRDQQIYSVEGGLKAFFEKEKVFGENRMHCNQCKNKQDAVIECEMTQDPEILSLLLKRFTFNSECNCYIKLHCNVYVPQTLHLENSTYDLYAVVHHFGDLTGGHYTAEIKSFENGEWYSFNDDVVDKVRKPLFSPGSSSVRSQTAYLLMYRKESSCCENPEHRSRLYVASDGRRDAATQRRPRDLDESGRGMDLSGEGLKTSNGDSSGEPEEHKDPRLQSASEENQRLQKDRGHHHLRFSSEGIIKHFGDGTFERNQISRKKSLNVDDIVWDRTEKDYCARTTETKYWSVRSPSVEASDVTTAGTNNISGLYPTKRLQTNCSVNKPSDCRLHAKQKKNRERVQPLTTASRRKTKTPQKWEEPVKQTPWK